MFEKDNYYSVYPIDDASRIAFIIETDYRNTVCCLCNCDPWDSELVQSPFPLGTFMCGED